MSKVKVCRICLRTEAKMYHFDEYQLKSYYEEVMALRVINDDGLPQYFCYECSTILHKFHKFKEKCYCGQKVLKELSWKGPISYESIYKLDRKETLVVSLFTFVTVDNQNQTYLTNNDSSEVLEQNAKGNSLQSVDNRIKYDSIDSLMEFGDRLDTDPVEVSMPEIIEVDGDLNIVNKIIRNNEGMTNLDEGINNVEKGMVSVDKVMGNIDEGMIFEKDMINGDKDMINVDEEGIINIVKDMINVNEAMINVDKAMQNVDKGMNGADEGKINEDKAIVKDNVDDVSKISDIHKSGIGVHIVVEVDVDEVMGKDDETMMSNTGKKIERSGRCGPKSVDIYVFNKDDHDDDDSKSKKKGLYPGLKVRNLDDKNWKISDLSEAEALVEFRARAEDKKYLNAPYKCTECFKGFSKEDMLIRHGLMKHNESIGRYECRFCRSRFRLDCYLRRHMKEHYVKYECLRCPLVCQLLTTALLHEESHSGVMRKCIYCNEQFRHMSTYYTHLRTHRSEHVCTLCGASFVSELGLRQHKNLKHITDDIESPDDYEEANTHCERCQMRFETPKAYKEHLFHSARHNNDKKPDADSVVASKKVLGKRAKAKFLNGNRKRIDQDVKVMNGKTTPKRKKPKTKAKPTTCHQCGQQFSTQAACFRHHLVAHPRTSFFAPSARHICEVCGASLAPGSVATHQNIHTREKVHTCDTCGKEFHTTIGLKRHLVTHTGEKPYGCLLCDKRFTQNNSMKLHYRTIHLKQPYPKRKRQTKSELKKTPAVGGATSNSDSDASPPDAEPKPSELGVEPAHDATPDRLNNESMHYLTLA